MTKDNCIDDGVPTSPRIGAETVFALVTAIEGESEAWRAFLTQIDVNNVDICLVVAKLRAYETMAHPRDLTTAGMRIPLIYPRYDHLARRQSDPYEDQKLCSVAGEPFRGRQHALDQRTVDLAYEVINYYARRDVAKRVLLIPTAYAVLEAQANGQSVPRPSRVEFTVQILTMMENILFEVYEELDEGEVITDEVMTRKLLQIVSGNIGHFVNHVATGVLTQLPD